MIATVTWQTVGHLADVVSIVGFPLAIIGLYVALNQLQRTQNAVEAAAEAQEKTERDSALRQLLVLLPSLSEVEQALENAVSQNDVSGARRELASWRLRGGEVHGMLAGRGDLPSGISDGLSKAIVQAGAAKQRLMDENVDLSAATERARTDISTATIALTELAARFKAYV